MSRKVKCKICKKELTNDKAFKVNDGKRNLYYCSEEEYNQMLKDKKDKEDCYSYLCSIINMEFLPPIFVKELNTINKYYEYPVITRTIKENIKVISWFLDSNSDGGEYGKARYISTIIKNNINRVSKIYKKEQEELANIFNPTTNEVDIDIINMDTQNNNIKNNKNDISQFLD